MTTQPGDSPLRNVMPGPIPPGTLPQPTISMRHSVWTPQLRLLCSAFGGLMTGVAVYALGGVIWRCVVGGLIGCLVIWLLTGSLIVSNRKWPTRETPKVDRHRNSWSVPALGIVLADPASFDYRLRPRMLVLAEQSLSNRQIQFQSAQGRELVGPRNHDILNAAGPPPKKTEITALIGVVTALNEHTGSGGARAVDEALAAKKSRQKGLTR